MVQLNYDMLCDIFDEICSTNNEYDKYLEKFMVCSKETLKFALLQFRKAKSICFQNRSIIIRIRNSDFSVHESNTFLKCIVRAMCYSNVLEHIEISCTSFDAFPICDLLVNFLKRFKGCKSISTNSDFVKSQIFNLSYIENLSLKCRFNINDLASIKSSPRTIELSLDYNTIVGCYRNISLRMLSVIFLKITCFVESSMLSNQFLKKLSHFLKMMFPNVEKLECSIESGIGGYAVYSLSNLHIFSNIINVNILSSYMPETECNIKFKYYDLDFYLEDDEVPHGFSVDETGLVKEMLFQNVEYKYNIIVLEGSRYGEMDEDDYFEDVFDLFY